jgi:hypothetical protein
MKTLLYVKKERKIAIAIAFLVILVFLSGHFLPPLYSPPLIIINVGMNVHYHTQ